MQNDWFKFRINRSTVILFWLAVLVIFLAIYFFAPSLFHEMRQATYQTTPFVNTPAP